MAEDKKPKFDKSAYDQQYMKNNIKVIQINLNRTHDADIIDHLNTKPNKSGYVKQLIRDDISKEDPEQ